MDIQGFSLCGEMGEPKYLVSHKEEERAHHIIEISMQTGKIGYMRQYH
jgi:hypothetical protein